MDNLQIRRKDLSLVNKIGDKTEFTTYYQSPLYIKIDLPVG